MRNLYLDHENRLVKYGVKLSDLQQIQQRRIEAHAERQTMSDFNLLRAVKLGEALRELRE